MSQVHKKIGYRLRKHRHLNGYTIREAAGMVGIGPTRLSQWERNMRKPSIENLIKLAVLYRVLVDELCLDMRQIAVKNLQKRNGQKERNQELNKPP